MLLKAIRSFTGNVRMRTGDIKEVAEEEIAKDLIRAGYAVKYEADRKGAKTTKKAAKKAETPAADTEDSSAPEAESAEVVEPEAEAKTEDTNTK